MNKVVTVITAKSESCDDYGPWVFETRPTDEQLEAFLREHAAGEFEENEDGEFDGPGIFGSYLHVEIHERNVFPIPGESEE